MTNIDSQHFHKDRFNAHVESIKRDAKPCQICGNLIISSGLKSMEAMKIAEVTAQCQCNYCGIYICVDCIDFNYQNNAEDCDGCINVCKNCYKKPELTKLIDKFIKIEEKFIKMKNKYIKTFYQLYEKINFDEVGDEINRK